MKLLSKQENAVYYLKDSTSKEIVYGGAAGGGKSALGVLWLIEGSLKFPGSRWLMGRAKLKSLKETTLNTFFDITSDLGLSGQYRFNSQSNIIYWDNGSEILLKDLYNYPADPKFDSLGSLEITGAFIDECNQVVLLAWQIVTSRCRYKLTDWDIHGERTENMEILERNKEGKPILWLNSKGEKTPGLIPKILGTCNPSKNWVYKEFYKASKEKTLKPERKFIQALPTDNPFLPKSYLQTLLSLDKSSVQRLYFGNWEYDDDPSTLIDADSIADYWRPDHIKKGPDMFMTIDVARKGKDTTVYRVWDGWVCIFRWMIPKSDLVEVVNKAKELRIRFNIPLTHIVADEDGVGGGCVDFLQCKGFVNNSSPMNGENFTNLKSQCTYKMAEKIVKRETGEICRESEVITATSEEMEQVKQKDIDKDGKVGIVPKEMVKLLIGRSPDEWDSIMMRYYFELIPKVFTF